MGSEVKIMIGDRDICHLQQLLNKLFEAGFHNILCVTNNEKIKDCLAIETPELVIIDWYFESPNCMHIIKSILDRYPDTPPGIIWKKR